MSKVGLIAGIGNLPVEFMRAAQREGYEVVVISVVTDGAPELQAEANSYYQISVFKSDTVIKTFKKEGVTDVTMLGKVTKEHLYKKITTIPDMRTIKILNRLRNRKDDTIMLAIVEELEKEGLRVADQTKYMRSLMPEVGVMTNRKPTEAESLDIQFGFTNGWPRYWADRRCERTGCHGHRSH